MPKKKKTNLPLLKNEFATNVTNLKNIVKKFN